MGWQPAAIFLTLDDGALNAIATLFASILAIVTIPPLIAARLTARAYRRAERGEEDEWIQLLAVGAWTLWMALERYLDLQGILQDMGLGIFASFTVAWV